jgi:dipeptidyl-peptidase-3
VQPQLKAVANGEEIKDVTVTYPDNFLQNQLELSKKYSFLPAYN